MEIFLIYASGGDGDNGYIYVSKWLYFDQPGRKSDATPSGNGGDGGCGGLGGLSGKIFIVGLQELNIKSLFNSSGIFCGKLKKKNNSNFFFTIFLQ